MEGFGLARRHAPLVRVSEQGEVRYRSGQKLGWTRDDREGQGSGNGLVWGGAKDKTNTLAINRRNNIKS